MKRWLSPTNIPEVIKINSSKSVSNRYLILGALQNMTMKIENISNSEDTQYLIEALKKIGCLIETRIDHLNIKGPFPQVEKISHEIIDLDVGEGGTTARFLTPLLSLGKNKYRLKMKMTLSLRPWDELLNVLRSLGVYCEFNEGHLIVQGPMNLKSKVIEVDCKRSSQFASALSLALSHHQVLVKPINLNSSLAYWEMTEEIIKNKNQLNIIVPGDWSSAAPLIALSVIKGSKTLFKDLREDHLQADSVLGNWLNKRGALKFSSIGVETVSLQDKSSFEIDVRNHQDLFPTWCYLASHMNGTSVLTGLAGLRFKETDRVKTVIDVLNQLGIKNNLEDDKLSITGPITLLKTYDLDPAFDHRVVMMSAIFLATYHGGSITNTESVNKSYPEFFDYFKTTELKL